MEYKIVWTLCASDNVEQTLLYLQSEWTEKIAFDYYEKLLAIISLIKRQPYSFPLFIVDKKIRCCPVTKHNMIYYRITEDEIFVLTVFDTRQNPNSLEL